MTLELVPVPLDNLRPLTVADAELLSLAIEGLRSAFDKFSREALLELEVIKLRQTKILEEVRAR